MVLSRKHDYRVVTCQVQFCCKKIFSLKKACHFLAFKYLIYLTLLYPYRIVLPE